MPDVLTLIFIVWMEHLWKCGRWFLKTGWVFCKIIAWLMVVPLLDLVTLTVAMVAFLICSLRNKRTPRLKHAKYGVVYPSWKIT